MNEENALPKLDIFTDGACLGNPGPGGFAAILDFQGTRKEIAGGFSLTTNNRMEIMAALAGLESLTKPCEVTIHSDSRYLCDAIEKRWLVGWEKKGWVTAAKTPVKNIDLWKRLRAQLMRHKVRFKWVAGHSGHPENERCDELARAEAGKRGLPRDAGYP